jgi:hypothetical protein
MQTGIAVAIQADKVINDSDCAKRILKIVYQLQEKIAVLERALDAGNTVRPEMVRVQSRLDEIEKALDDPATELGSEIRLNRERAELQAYLRGLLYSLGELTTTTFQS